MRLVFCGLDSSLLGAGVFVARVLCFLAVVCVSPVRAGTLLASIRHLPEIDEWKRAAFPDAALREIARPDRADTDRWLAWRCRHRVLG